MRRLGEGRFAVVTQNEVVVRNTSNGDAECTCRGHKGEVVTAAITPDGAILATGGKDPIVKLWDARSGKLLRELDAAGAVRSLSFSPDGQKLVVGNEAGKVEVWDTTSKR